MWEGKNSKPDEEISFSPVVSWAGDSGSSDREGDRRRLGSKLLIGAAVLAAVGLVVGVVVRSGGDDGAAVPDTTVTTAPSTPTTLDVVAPPESGDDRGDPPPSITPVDVDLPSAVAAISAPTEVIALNSDGVVHTLSLPSGRVRSVAVGQPAGGQLFDYRGGGIGVSPTAAAIGVVDSTYVVVPRTGLPIGVDLEALGGNSYGGVELLGWQLAENGSTQFTVNVYADFTSGQLVTVDESGGIALLDAPDTTTDGLGFGFVTPEGSRIVNDAGGAYEVGADGTSQRIDDGTVYAATGDHRVVRQCDGTHRCEMTLVTASTGDRRVLDSGVLPEDFENLVSTMTLAPDGTAVSALRGGGGPSDQEVVIVDLTEGEVAMAPMMFARYPEVYGTWAADSSGVFGIPFEGVGLQFVARSGETVDFGESLGEIVAIGVRHPDAELGPAADIAWTALSMTRPLDPTGIAFVGAGRAGGLSYVDIDARVIESWATSADLGAGRGILIVTADDAVLGLPYAGDTAFVTRLGGEVSLVPELGLNGNKFAGPGEGTIWVVNDRPGDVDGVDYRMVRLDGQTVVDDSSSAIWVPGAAVIGGDGRGNLVVEHGGDIFVVGVDGAERLTSGELVAVGADTAYARECDETMTCSLIRIDRQSGERRTVDAGFDLAAVVGGATIERGPTPGTTVSPGGDVLLVELSVVDGNASRESDQDSWFFADTTTGRLTQVDDPDANQPVIWNVDGTFAVVLTGPTVQIFDRAAAEMVRLNTAPMRSIGRVPPN